MLLKIIESVKKRIKVIKKNKAFTLTELIAVIVILSILITLSVVVFMNIRGNILEKEYTNLVSYLETKAALYAKDTGITTISVEDLIKEGLARELVSKVQNMRKEKDFNIEDRINLFYNGNSYFESVLKEFESYIKEETLALSLIKKEDLTNLVKLNDLDVYLDIEKR